MCNTHDFGFAYWHITMKWVKWSIILNILLYLYRYMFVSIYISYKNINFDFFTYLIRKKPFRRWRMIINKVKIKDRNKHFAIKSTFQRIVGINKVWIYDDENADGSKRAWTSFSSKCLGSLVLIFIVIIILMCLQYVKLIVWSRCLKRFRFEIIKTSWFVFYLKY